MAVSGGQVVVDIIANTAGFNAGIAKAEAGIAGLGTTVSATSTHQASWDAHTQKNIASLKGVANENSALENAIVGYNAVITEASGKTDRAGHSMEGLHVHTRRAHLGFLGIGTSTLAAGVGVFAAAQAFHHLQEAMTVTGAKALTTGGKIRNALAALTTLDVVGAIEALTAGQSNSEKFKALKANLNSTSVDYRNFARSSGVAADATQKQADALATVHGAVAFAGRGAGSLKVSLDAQAASMRVNADAAIAMANALDTAASAQQNIATKIAAAGGSDTAAFGEQSGLYGRGPGGIDAEAGAPGAGMKYFKPRPFGLSQQVQTAVALAKATGTKAQEIAQDRRAIRQLEKQLRSPQIGDKDREKVANQIESYTNDIDAIYRERATKAREAAATARRLRAAAAAKAKAATRAMESTLKDAIDSMQQDLTSAMTSSAGALGALFGGPILDPKTGHGDGGHKGWFGSLAKTGPNSIGNKINADLDAQVKATSKFYAQLNVLKKHGASQELIKQLIEGGPEDYKYVTALASEATAKGKKGALWDHFLKQFKAGQNVVHELAEMQVKAKTVHLAAGNVFLTVGKGHGENTVHVTVNMDGKKVSEHVVTHLNKRSKGSSGSRKGRNRGKTTGVGA